MPGNLTDTLAVAALIQCLVKALSDEIDGGTYQHDCHPMMVRQNKWRATRFGTGAQLVDSYSYQVVTVAQAVDDLVDKLTPVAAHLGSEHHLEHCRHMAASPSWADRQLSIFADTGSAEAIVRQLTEVSRLSPVV
jgi:carboxylate-amine ligase